MRLGPRVIAGVCGAGLACCGVVYLIEGTASVLTCVGLMVIGGVLGTPLATALENWRR